MCIMLGDQCKFTRSPARGVESVIDFVPFTRPDIYRSVRLAALGLHVKVEVASWCSDQELKIKPNLYCHANSGVLLKQETCERKGQPSKSHKKPGYHSITLLASAS